MSLFAHQFGDLYQARVLTQTLHSGGSSSLVPLNFITLHGLITLLMNYSSVFYHHAPNMNAERVRKRTRDKH